MDGLLPSPEDLPGPDLLSHQAVAQRAAQVLRPKGALARLDRVASWLAGWQRTDCPAVQRPVALLAAGDHGVVARGVTSWPSQVTAAMVDAIRANVATSAVMAEAAGVLVRLVDAGVGDPTGDISTEPALTKAGFSELFELGRRHVSEIDTDLLLLGEMGIGNTTSAAAIAYSLFGGSPREWVGPGAGLDEEGMDRKAEVVAAASNRVGSADPMELLRQLGGSELTVLAGACLEARLRSIPVVLDGYVVGAAVAPIGVAVPGALDHCLAGHVSAEPGHRLLLDALGLEPLLDLGMHLGEGSGAIAAVPLIRLAARAVVDVATFGEWGLG